jgi:hypothetical protein
VIWIEHVVRALTSLVSRLTCLYGGQFVGDGDPASVLANPKVREIYLGVEVTAEQLAAEAGGELAGGAGASGAVEPDGPGGYGGPGGNGGRGVPRAGNEPPMQDGPGGYGGQVPPMQDGSGT